MDDLVKDEPRARRVRLGLAAALAALLAACGEGAPAGAPQASADADAPRVYSLIPRADLFGDPQRARGRLSPDGTTLAWLEPDEGVLNIWTAPVDAPEDGAPITHEREVGVYEFDWLRNNTHIEYTLGRGGAEPQRVYSVDVITGQVRDLAPGGPETRSRVAAMSWDYPDEIVVSANDRDPSDPLHPDLYRVNVVTGARKKIFENGEEERFTRLFLNQSLELTAASRDRPDGSRELFARGESRWLPTGVIEADDATETRQLGFDGTNKSIYSIDSRGRDYAALVRRDLDTRGSTVEAAVEGADISDALLHPTTFEADAVLVEGLSIEWRPLTTRAAEAFRVLNEHLHDPYTVLSRTVDDRLWVVFERGPTNPGFYHLFNRETEEVRPLIEVRPALAGRRLAPMNPVIVEARDGLELVGFLTLPAGADMDGDGQPEKASPLVVIPEAGPQQRRTALGYEPIHQWLADRGYAALTINLRGAPGLGRAYRTAGDGEVGGAAQGDLRDAVDWAVKRGVADPGRVAVFGLLLGGHAALMEAAAPDTPFACAAAYNAPMDLVGLLERVPPFWASSTPFLRLRLGDPADPANRARLEARSPIAFASSIRLPTLVGHGALEGGDQFALARQTVEKANAAGGRATFIGMSEDAGSLQSPLDRRAFYAALEAFFSNCLGGRIEPIDDDVRGAQLDAPAGVENIPQLAAALR